ncbi:aquaporin [Demequina sp. TTPB684]|uniref:MIP/aquaporin family protein n=1 Tax=unclassified Demequina TaxID=2620311 RepID=UPI001CF20B45|nr:MULTISPECIES: aquaporin [unclassified Demequina]MCB2412283.1 aquaporin [Demequina sp. TTPB684]UPU88482.1 aquaporin [Demequina sp. TMPB413]
MADETTPTESDEFTDDLVADTWSGELALPSLPARLGAEALGTFVLVLLGVGTAAMVAVQGRGPLDTALAFGLALMIGTVVFSAVSGAHFNPAVSVGAWLAGRLPGIDVVPYILAQVVGGIAGAGVVRLGMGSLEAVNGEAAMGLMGAVAPGFDDRAPLASSGLNFGIPVALAVEMIAAGLLTLVVLAVAAKRITRAIAPFATGLTFAALMLWTIPFTNGALNPAKATATALFADEWALGQLWLWWLAPILGGAIVGLLFRIYGPVADTEPALEPADA